MNTSEDHISFELPKNRSSAIKVIGVGGGGSNAVNYMHEQGITGVDFIICNTDAQALNNSPIKNKIQLGVSITEGMGAGANPEVGEQAALESLEDIKAYLESSTKMIFITAGMGGGTGTGAAPIIAGIAKELGILTVAIVTAPFYFEGKMRLEQAQKGIEKLRSNVDSLIVINNDKLRELYGNLGYKAGFAKADEVLTTAAKGIAEVITHHYATNIDLRDAKTVLANSGTAIMGSFKASGENKAKEAIEGALDSPLLNDNRISGAKNVLLLIVSGNEEVTIDEIATINDHIQNEAGHSANIIMGIGEDPDLGEDISVTIVATGFPKDDQRYTGQEDQKIVHQLEEDQPFIKEFSTEKPMNFNPRPKPSNEKIVVHDLDEEVEEKEEDSITFEVRNTETPTSSQKPPNTLFDLDFSEKETPSKPQKLDINQPLPNKEKGASSSEQIITFDLDDDEPANSKAGKKEELDEDEITFEVRNESSELNFENTSDNPFEQPIDNALQNEIAERRARLQKYNQKFMKSSQDIDSQENIPAYERKGIELNEKEKTELPRYILDEGQDKELKIRPNNFLHDNVD